MFTDITLPHWKKHTQTGNEEPMFVTGLTSVIHQWPTSWLLATQRHTHTHTPSNHEAKCEDVAEYAHVLTYKYLGTKTNKKNSKAKYEHERGKLWTIHSFNYSNSTHTQMLCLFTCIQQYFFGLATDFTLSLLAPHHMRGGITMAGESPCCCYKCIYTSSYIYILYI